MNDVMPGDRRTRRFRQSIPLQVLLVSEIRRTRTSGVVQCDHTSLLAIDEVGDVRRKEPREWTEEEWIKTEYEREAKETRESKDEDWSIEKEDPMESSHTSTTSAYPQPIHTCTRNADVIFPGSLQFPAWTAAGNGGMETRRARKGPLEATRSHGRATHLPNNAAVDQQSREHGGDGVSPGPTGT